MPSEPEKMPAAIFSTVITAAAVMELSATWRFSAECAAGADCGKLEVARGIASLGYAERVAVYNPAMPKV